MKKGLFLLMVVAACLGASAQVFAKDVSLAWDRNQESDISGYKIYYKSGSSTGTFDGADATQGKSPLDVKNVTALTLNGLDPAKNYYFQITAYDTAGNESGFSNMVQSYESLPPTIAITAPGDKATVNGTVGIAANATDNTGVAKVDFLVNNVLAGTATAAPYGYSWDTAKLQSGTYTITARAYDAAGNTADGTISVTVNNAAPTPTVTAHSGDSNGDGVVDIADALQILQAAVNPSLQTDAIKAAGDVWPLDANGKPKGDGVVNLNDALLILQRAVGLAKW